MVITKPRKQRVDLATKIIIVLAAIAVILAACQYKLTKSYIEDLEVIEPTPQIVTEKISVVEIQATVKPRVEETDDFPIFSKPLEIRDKTEPEETVVELVAEPETMYTSLGEFKITAYCACKNCCGQYAEGRPLDDNGNPIVYGATGNALIPGYSIAIDPDVIPYGTKVYIDGREYIAHDTGGAIDGNRIDLFMVSHEDALEWGVRYREVFK